MKEIKFCPYCRAGIVAGQKFCSVCGKGIPVPPSCVEPAPLQSTQERSSTKTPVKNNKTLVGILIAVILVLAVGLVFALTRKDNNDNKASYEPVQEYETIVDDGETDEEVEFLPDKPEDDANVVYTIDFVCERLVTESDIAGYSKDDLRIMRNWIYARHGYIFKSQDLKNYFSQFSWYNPRYSDVSSQLSNIERQNVEFIKRHE